VGPQSLRQRCSPGRTAFILRPYSVFSIPARRPIIKPWRYAIFRSTSARRCWASCFLCPHGFFFSASYSVSWRATLRAALFRILLPLAQTAHPHAECSRTYFSTTELVLSSFLFCTRLGAFVVSLNLRLFNGAVRRNSFSWNRVSGQKAALGHRAK